MRLNPVAAVLRGELAIEGDWRLLVLVQRLFPGPPTSSLADEPPATRRGNVSDDLVKILDGNTFVVSDERGDIEASLTDPTGLFSFDTRFLSRWVLTVNGERLNALSVDDLQYFETRFFLVPGTGTVYIDAKLSVIRQRAVADGFHEELTILNHADKAANLTVRIDAGVRLRGPVRGQGRARARRGKYSTQVENGKLRLGYDRGTFGRATEISSTAPAKFDADGLTFRVRIEPHGEWKTELDVITTSMGPGQAAEGARDPRARSGAHAAEPGEVDRRCASGRVRPGLAEGDLPAEPRRSRGAPLLAADRRRAQRFRPPGFPGS